LVSRKCLRHAGAIVVIQQFEIAFDGIRDRACVGGLRVGGVGKLRTPLLLRAQTGSGTASAKARSAPVSSSR
jgi:hypothetical protein